MKKQAQKRQETDFDFVKKPKKPKGDVKFDPSRKNKKYYIQKGYESYEH